MKLLFSAAVVAAMAFAGTAAQAGQDLTGDQITSSYEFPQPGFPCCGDISFSPAIFVVGPGVESVMTVAGKPLQVDFGAHSLTITTNDDTFNGPAPDNFNFFNGPIFTDNTGADFGAVTGVTGLDASRVALVGDALRINWGGIAFQAGDQVVVTFGEATAGTGVPEPASWALMVLGFGGLGATLRFRSRRLRAA